ncbi:MAG: hypothetical protein ACXWTT_00190 [Methylobacter sp.]
MKAASYRHGLPVSRVHGCKCGNVACHPGHQDSAIPCRNDEGISEVFIEYL